MFHGPIDKLMEDPVAGPRARPVVSSRRRAGPVTLEVEALSDGLDVAAMRAFLRGRAEALRGCAEKALNRREGPARTIQGRVVVEARVTPDGRLQGVQIVEERLRDELTSACIKTLMRNWITPFTPAGLVPIKLTLDFAPPG